MKSLRSAAAKLLVAGLLSGAGWAAANWTSTWTGSLTDVLCKPENIAAGIKKCTRTRQCLLSERCSASGYGIVLADGTFLKFDIGGSVKALEILKAMTKDSDLRVTVTGTLAGDAIRVDTLEIR